VPDASSAPQQKPGDSAYAVAQQQLNKPYVYGSQGPDTFDCSGLMCYSYAQGPHMDIGRDTTSQWNNQTTLSTFFDALQPVSGQPSKDQLASQMEVGDLILYFQPGNSGEYAHVKMYAGGGQTIEAPHTGAVVCMNPLDLVGDSTEPFRGVKRPTGGGSAGGPASGGGGGGGGGANSNPGVPTGTNKAFPGVKPVAGALPDLSTDAGKQAAMEIALADLPDPRNNLPFDPHFAGKTVAGGASSNQFGQPASAQFGYMPNDILVRGGMMELLTNTDTSGDPLKATMKQRKGGPFACYFMMNPQSIATDCSITTDATAPSQTDPTALQAGPYWVQNQSISFTLIFNRMYEVYMGGFNNPKDGSPGPSAIGCRWDIRAIERLMGVYDAQSQYPGLKKGQKLPGGATGITGLGTYGAGDRPPMSLPIQVVFGSPPGSPGWGYQFQGLISSLDYTYTLFSKDMIPIEATVDIGIMRMYLPNLSSADVMNPLVSDKGQYGTIIAPGQPSGFNNPKAFRG